MDYFLRCHCGNVNVSATFPHPVEEYVARKCDCDFCMAHDLAYLSDVNATFTLSSNSPMTKLKQGSQQATFWQCKNCKEVVAVTSENNGETRGALSKNLFTDKYPLKPSVIVSPKTLSATEKSERWPTVWSKVV